MPTLARRHHVEGLGSQSGVLGIGLHVADLYTALPIQLAGLRHEIRRRIKAGDPTAARRKAARKRAGAGSDIKQILSRNTHTPRCDTGKNIAWKPRPMPAVVAGRSSEIDRVHIVIPPTPLRLESSGPRTAFPSVIRSLPPRQWRIQPRRRSGKDPRARAAACEASVNLSSRTATAI